MFRPQKLLALRKYAGLRQQDLAKEADVARPTIQRLESGKTHNPRLSTLQQLAEFFGVDVKVFFTDEELSLK